MLLKPSKIAHIPALFHAHLTLPGTLKWPESGDSFLQAHIEFIFLIDELESSSNFISAVRGATVLERLGKLTGFI
jgi:hypothetical protein